MSYQVVIPTAGIGSRLGSETQNLNKSLITLGNKPIISRIIEKFPKNCEFVILIGFKGKLVRDYLKIAHGNLNITFIKVKNFSGKSSGLGLSLSYAKKILNKPFVFASCDTIVKERIPPPNTNWLGFSSDRQMLKSYRTIDLKNKKFVNNFYEKGKSSKNVLPYIGLAGFKDPKFFWKILKNASQKDFLKGESYCIDQMLKISKFKAYKFNWMDTGNIKKLNIYKKKFLNDNSYNILEKKNEAIWFIGGKVIKFSLDENFIKKRFIRAEYIKKYIPKLISRYKNYYSYKKENGKTLSSIINLRIFKKFMNHCEKFWEINPKINTTKKRNYLNFYKKKTLSRIDKFYEENNIKDKIEKINNIETPKLSVMLKKIDWQNLSRGIPVTFHGDLHFENVLINKKKNLYF